MLDEQRLQELRIAAGRTHGVGLADVGAPAVGDREAEAMFAGIKEWADFLLTTLPSMYEYLNRLHAPAGPGTREEDLAPAESGGQ